MEGIGTAVSAVIGSIGKDEPIDWSRNSNLIRRVVAQVLLDAPADGEALFHRHKRLCESPIECIALAALVVLFPGAEVVAEARELKGRDDWIFGIVPQMPIRGYRLDFGVFNNETRRAFALECDGREYHRNWRRDFNRDMALWENEVIAYHVSGSALCRSPIDALEPFARKVRAR